MKQLILSLLTGLLVSVGYCQDTLLVHNVNSTSREFRLEDVTDEKSNRLYLFIISQFAIDCYEIDMATKAVTGQLSTPRSEDGYETTYFKSVKDRRVHMIFGGS
jgi:hypothetical protein